MSEPPKRLIDEGSLWIMIAVPSVWAAHFLLCYWLAAAWCARAVGDLGAVRPWLLALTGLALAAIALLGWKARRTYHGRYTIEDALTGDTDHERRRFLGHATLLLCGLSAVAVAFDTLPALVFDRCW